MNRAAGSFVALVLTLSPCAAWAAKLCIQLNDDGDVLVLQGIGKGSKAVSGHLADFVGILDEKPIYSFRPVMGSAIFFSRKFLALGLTEYYTEINDVGSPGSFAEITTFHRVRCNPGSDGRLGEADSCQDITNRHPNPDQEIRNGIIFRCSEIPSLSIP